MFNFDYATNKDIKSNQNWSEITNHPYWMLIFGGSDSRKTNELLNLIKNKPGMHKSYLYAKDLYEANYQLLMNKTESTRLICLNDSKFFIKLSINKLYEQINKWYL